MPGVPGTSGDPAGPRPGNRGKRKGDIMEATTRGTTASVEYWQFASGAGYRVVAYSDDDGGSGYGDNAATAAWYGTRVECDAIAAAVNAGTPFADACRDVEQQAAALAFDRDVEADEAAAIERANAEHPLEGGAE